MPTSQLRQLFAVNRAEELGYDVWKQFVLPPFYEELSVGNTKKPKVIIGGRGCGKTMLLRYLSHESTFSREREKIPESALSHIGIYWRADTQFASLMQRRGTEDDIWESAFRHLTALVLGTEVLRSLESIASSSIGVFEKTDDINSLNFQRLGAFSNQLPPQYLTLRNYLEDELAVFESWVNDVRSIEKPRFLPGADFVSRLVSLVLEQVPKLKNAVFFVYVDEYENLAVYQQRIINTWLKHSEPPLIFNFAMKRNGFKTRATEGEESLSDIHDFRDIDLENFDLGSDFPVFAAEILLLRLQLANTQLQEIRAELLRDISKMEERKSQAYQDSVLSAVRYIFPSLSHQQLAEEALNDSLLRKRLEQRIQDALTRRSAKSEASDFFLQDKFPQASLVAPALISRPSLQIADIKKQFRLLLSGEENKFTGTTDWIHNNFVGCFLQLYDGLVRPCPLYSGFSTFCYMARGNLRHLLELSFRALARSEDAGNAIGTVDVSMQAEAARQTSADLLAEIRSFGAQGNNLYAFVLRLGSLFLLSQQQLSQSEPERTHFSIQGGRSEMGEEETTFLNEAIKWSVLFEEKGTKKKSATDPEGTEYVLNPIYAPYFHISYRKRRKLDLSPQEASTLIIGSYASVRQLLGDFQRRWGVESPNDPLPLFAHLSEQED